MNEAALEPAGGAVGADPYKVPFVKNWAWWTALCVAIPSAFLATWIVILSTRHGGEYNWLMALAIFVTFLCALGLTVLPLLMALGFMVGGKVVTTTEDSSSEAVGDTGDESDFDGFDDEDGFEDDDLDMDEDDEFDFDDE